MYFARYKERRGNKNKKAAPVWNGLQRFACQLKSYFLIESTTALTVESIALTVESTTGATTVVSTAGTAVVSAGFSPSPELLQATKVVAAIKAIAKNFFICLRFFGGCLKYFVVYTQIEKR